MAAGAALTSTKRPMLAMWGEESLTVSSFSICKGKHRARHHRELGQGITNSPMGTHSRSC